MRYSSGAVRRRLSVLAAGSVVLAIYTFSAVNAWAIEAGVQCSYGDPTTLDFVCTDGDYTVASGNFDGSVGGVNFFDVVINLKQLNTYEFSSLSIGPIAHSVPVTWNGVSQVVGIISGHLDYEFLALGAGGEPASIQVTVKGQLAGPDVVDSETGTTDPDAVYPVKYCALDEVCELTFDMVQLQDTANTAIASMEIETVGEVVGIDPVVDYTAGPVPETSTWAMMALGFGGLAFTGYRVSRKTAFV